MLSAERHGMTSNGRAEAVLCAESWSTSSYPRPTAGSIRRAQVWQPHRLTSLSLDRVAHHEAGHVVFLEWLGWPCASAKASPDGGHVVLQTLPANLPAEAEDLDGVLTASAAGLYHAGTCAEMLHSCVPWVGPVHRPRQTDHALAEAMLAPTFGCHHSGAHAFAQRLALHVLSERWGRVREVASALVERGSWCPCDV